MLWPKEGCNRRKLLEDGLGGEHFFWGSNPHCRCSSLAAMIFILWLLPWFGLGLMCSFFAGSNRFRTLVGGVYLCFVPLGRGSKESSRGTFHFHSEPRDPNLFRNLKNPADPVFEKNDGLEKNGQGISPFRSGSWLVFASLFRCPPKSPRLALRRLAFRLRRASAFDASLRLRRGTATRWRTC